MAPTPPELLNYEKDVAAVTLADVQAAAKRYLRQDNYVQMVLKPEIKPVLKAEAKTDTQ